MRDETAASAGMISTLLVIYKLNTSETSGDYFKSAPGDRFKIHAECRMSVSSDAE